MSSQFSTRLIRGYLGVDDCRCITYYQIRAAVGLRSQLYIPVPQASDGRRQSAGRLRQRPRETRAMAIGQGTSTSGQTPRSHLRSEETDSDRENPARKTGTMQ